MRLLRLPLHLLLRLHTICNTLRREPHHTHIQIRHLAQRQLELVTLADLPKAILVVFREREGAMQKKRRNAHRLIRAVIQILRRATLLLLILRLQ